MYTTDVQLNGLAILMFFGIVIIIGLVLWLIGEAIYKIYKFVKGGK